MTMYSICQELIAAGKLDESIESMAKAEASFTREIGVLDRHYYQCVQQPHMIWARTEWTSEKAHNTAAQSIMQVRADDRVASAYFRPGLYYEIFALPEQAASIEYTDDQPAFLVIAHGLVETKSVEHWEERVAERLADLPKLAGLQRILTFRNYYARGEFAAFFEWSSEAAYLEARLLGERTLEEHVLVRAERSDLAGYNQFECLPLAL